MKEIKLIKIIAIKIEEMSFFLKNLIVIIFFFINDFISLNLWDIKKQ